MMRENKLEPYKGRHLMINRNVVAEQSIKDKIESNGARILGKGTVNESKYVNAVLYSTLGRWSLAHTGNISIPELSAEEQRPFIRLVDEILQAKAADPHADTRHLEWDIDRLVYDLYGLTEEEDTAIERSLGLIHATDEEEDAAIARAIDEALTEEGRGDIEELRAILREWDGS